MLSSPESPPRAPRQNRIENERINKREGSVQDSLQGITGPKDHSLPFPPYQYCEKKEPYHIPVYLHVSTRAPQKSVKQEYNKKKE